MQFSVIVEGNTNSKGSDGDSWEELECYLQSAKISPSLLKQLQPGQAQVLKNSLSYEQAVTISDRLADLGLESAIDPPIKPEMSETAAVPSAKECITGKIAGAKGTSNSQVLAGRGSKADRSTGLKAVETSATATHVTKKQRVAASRSMSGGAANGPTPNRPQQSTIAARPATGAPSPSPLSKAAGEIKALFTLPPGGKLNFTLPRASRFRLCCLAAYSIGIPALLMLAFASCVLAAGGLLLALHGLITGWFPLLGLAVLVAPVLVYVAVVILLTVPAWSRQGYNPGHIIARPKEEPRLAILTSAVCQVIGAKPPGKIYLTPEPRIHAVMRCKVKDFLAFSRPIEGETELFLGAPLLASLSIRELSALIARECGRFSQPAFRRPYMIIAGLSAWSNACRRRKPIGEGLALTTRPGSDVPRRAARFAVQLQGVGLRSIAFCEKKVNAVLCRHDSIADCYQYAALGDSSFELRERIEEIGRAYQQALNEMLRENENQRFVDGLSELTRDLLQSDRTAQHRPQPLPGIVRSKQTASALLDNFATLDRQLTRTLYEAEGLNTDGLQLMPLQELRRREANEAKRRKLAHAYYGNWLQEGQFWLMPAEDFANNAEEKILVSHVNHCISRVRYLSPDRPLLVTKHEKLRRHLIELKAAKKVIATGAPFRFPYCADVAGELNKQIAFREAKLVQCEEELRQQNTVMGERIALGLALDKEHRGTTQKIHRALHGICRISGKLNKLAADLDELAILQDHRPKKPAQDYQAHIKELTGEIERTYRFLRRSLQQCPYDFYDRRYSDLNAVLDSALHHTPQESAEHTLPHKARVLLHTVAQAYRRTSELAASYAARMEKAHDVETVKRV